MELIQFETAEEKRDRQVSMWDDDYQEPEKMIDDLSQERPSLGQEEFVLSPEGFFQLKIGMRVRHPKFGEGRVKSVEGMEEEQKATVLFHTAGSKRLKVRYANLEILE